MKNKALNFIEALTQDNPGCEAVALYENGEMVLEHHFVSKPPRGIFSHTKSYVATAAGMAIDEGKLSLDDKLLDLFPEYRPVVTDERMHTVTLRNALTMSTGMGEALLMNEDRKKGVGFPDYLEYLFSQPIKHTPGEKFTYSSADSHLVGCAVQRAVGETLQRYLYRKLFSKLDMGFPGWETDPAGTVFGGSGLFLSISQMMKLGILYLNQGIWNGEQILSPEWIKEASRPQIEISPGDYYGYQFWIMPKQNAYRAAGAFCQLTIVFPDRNAVFATQCSEKVNSDKFCNMLDTIVYS